MAERQIVVNLVSDETDFTRAMDRAGKSAQGMSGKLDDAGKSAAQMEDRWKDVADQFDDTEQPIIGLADVMDGLATTMGLEGVDAAIQYTRGIADMASGIGNGLIPVVTTGAAKVKAMSAAFLASPHAKLKLGLVAAGAAATYLAHETGNLNKVLDKGKDLLGMVAEGADIVAGGFLKMVGAGEAVESLNTTLEDARFGADDVTNALASMERQTQTLGQFTGSLRGIVDNMNNSFGDLSERIYTAAVSMYELYKQQGMFLSQAQAMRNLGMAGPYTQSNENTAFMPGPKSPSQIAAEAEGRIRAATSASNKAAKAAETAANKAAKAAEKAAAEAEKKLQARFSKIEKTLDSALKKWEDKVKNAKAVRDQIRGLFDLEPGADPTAEGGLVARLRKQAADMEKWTKKIAELRKKGFREELIRDLVDRGPDSLADATELSHVSVKDTNATVDAVKNLRNSFADSEAKRRTGTDPNSKGVKVTLDVKGSDKELVKLIKKWVKEEGGGDVQVAFGKK